MWFTGPAMMEDTSEAGRAAPGEAPGAESDDHRVIWVEFVESERVDVADGADLFDEATAVRSSLRHNGDAKTLSEAIHDAAGGADRVQMQVIRERLLGIEARTAETQIVQHRLGRELNQIRMLLYVMAAMLGALLLLAVGSLLV
jgi:hypothetical protein